MRRLLQTTLPRVKPQSVRDGFCRQKNNQTNFVAPSVYHQMQHCSTQVGGKSIDKILVQERTLNAIIDAKRAKGLYVSPSLADNIKHIFDFFPFSPEVVEGILVDHPEVLVHSARKILNLVTMVVELSDFTDVTQEEALMFVARSPEILSMDPVKVRAQMSAMISVTSEFHISWNSVMIASPQTIMMDPNHVGKRLIDLQEYFDPQQIRDVVGNNPNIFLMNWSDLKKIMGFLESTMNVSARRVSITPASLTHPLAFYQTRYQFLLRCGHYRHPDPGAKAKIPAEASPSLHLITDTSDERFVHKCCPGVSLEEWNTFQSIMEMEKRAEEALVEDDDDDEEERHNYNVKPKTKSTFSKKETRKIKAFSNHLNNKQW